MPPPGDVGSTRSAPSAPGAEARQRWRLTYRRDTLVALGLSQRDELEAWEAALVASQLPIVGLDGGRGRPRLQHAAALPPGATGRAELADLFLRRRLTIDVVREALIGSLPPWVELLDLHDVWLGEPALQAQVTAADYRVTLEMAGTADGQVDELAAAARRLLARESLLRDRPKGSGTRRYDLRPLLGDVRVLEAGPPVVLRIRVRFDPMLGVGRPEEVLAAIGDLVGHPCRPSSVARERLILGTATDGEDGG